jgi:hypothetical protein
MTEIDEPFEIPVSPSAKRDQLRMELNSFILTCAARYDVFVEADTLWFDVVSAGKQVSSTTFYCRLRELVEASRLEKKKVRKNKFMYRVLQHSLNL